MNSENCFIQKKRLYSTNFIKAFAIIMVIINHTLNYSKEAADRVILAGRYNFWLWVYQGVSFFLIVTGIHYAISISHMYYSGGGIKNWYSKKIFTRKLSRILIPYMIQQVIFILWFVQVQNGNFADGIKYSFKGGLGPGGYYTVLIIQILIIFPILFYALSQNVVIGSLSILTINIIYEFLVSKGYFTSSFYRLCCLRIITGIAIGVLFYLYYDTLKGTVIPALFFLSGLLFLININKWGYKMQIISGWTTSSFAGIPFAAGIVWMVVSMENKLEKISKKNRVFTYFFECISLIGKASFHIFLVQQFYFYVVQYKWYGASGLIKNSIIDTLICVFIGEVFYIANEKLPGIVHHIIRKKQI